jgi:proteasome lid subunit RPN8/RPN11
LFLLEKGFAQEMIDHARREAPDECCGLLAGKGHKVLRVYPARNALKSPIRYSLDPKELYQLLQEIERQGWELLGIYHSHTHTQAHPSATDIELGFWPDALYFIISLQDPKAPQVRAFYIRGGRVTEEELTIR